MTTQHTPGEWYLNDNNREDMHVRAGKGGFVIAEVDSSGTHFIGNQTEAYANARLIAAAPELLEALTALLKERTPENIHQAEAVILKATGDKVDSGGVDNTLPPQEEWITEIYDQDGHYIGMIKHSIGEEELNEKIHKHFEEVNDNLEDFCQNTPGCERIYVDGSIYL